MECPVAIKDDKYGDDIDIWTFVFEVILNEKGRIKNRYIHINMWQYMITYDTNRNIIWIDFCR